MLNSRHVNWCLHVTMPLRFATLLIIAAIACAPLALYAQSPVGELYSTVARVRGSVNVDSGGTTVLSGSSIESGEQPASLVLHRGGTLTICQDTIVSVSASANGHDLLFSFGTGTIETRYSMTSSADMVVTPDLRFVVVGPGEFDLDIGVTAVGDTCVRSHKESTGGVIVSEQMGDGTYQVKPSDFVLFRKGRVTDVQVNPPAIGCGCPVPRRTRVDPLPTTEPATSPSRTTPTSTPSTTPTTTIPSSLKTPLARSIVEGDKHMEVDAPFIFDADRPAPALTERVMKLRVEPSLNLADVRPAVQPPKGKPAKRGFWHRFKKALFG